MDEVPVGRGTLLEHFASKVCGGLVVSPQRLSVMAEEIDGAQHSGPTHSSL
jgi:hypothetical protein